MLARTLKIACIQLKVGANKAENVARAVSKIRDAKGLGAELIALPGWISGFSLGPNHKWNLFRIECFNSPYGTSYFPQYAESIPDGETSKSLSGNSSDKTLSTNYVN